MFLGHFALAFAAKRMAPKVSLGTTVLAAQLADAIWPILLLLGLERVAIVPGITAVTPLDFVSYPYSHSLLADLLWAAALGGAYFLWRRDTRGALCIGALVLSHWLLDAISHRPDMPLYPGGPLVGGGLWYSLPATLVVEFLVFALGVKVYLGATRALDKTGTIALWSFVGLLAILYLGAVFGPPPPDITTLAASGLFGWLLMLWAWWIDRHRSLRTET